MSNDAPAALQTAATTDGGTDLGFDPLDALEFSKTTGKRAIYEEFEFHPQGGGDLEIRNVSHGADAADNHTYTVRVVGGIPADCSCPADTFHDGACKHRVALARAKPVLESAEADQEKPLLADGGTEEIVVAGDEGELVDEDHDVQDTRPEGCICRHSEQGLPCFPCWLAGFETPNPEATREEGEEEDDGDGS